MRRRTFLKSIIMFFSGIFLFKHLFKNYEDINCIEEHENGKYLLSKITINVTDHCNLNCKNCDTYSSIATPKYLEPQKLQKDLKRFRDLVGNSIEKIGLLGGEPLLNKNISHILNICRFYFPEPTICLVTNGILLNKMNQYFWDSCRENNIVISVSVYPINVDFKQIKELADKNDVSIYFSKVKYKGNTFDWRNQNKLTQKFQLPKCIKSNEIDWQKQLLDINGKQYPKDSYDRCHATKRVYTMLVDGKIYCCYMASQIHHFNNYFNTNLKIEASDYLDIYKIKNKKEIWKFLETPPPFCKYCVCDHGESINWGFTKKDIKEWT